VRRLVIPWRLGNDNIDFPGLEEWLLDFPCVSYEKKKRSLVGSVLKTNRVEDFSSMFCSGLQTHTPQHQLFFLLLNNFINYDFEKIEILF
jgi:predicted YcjX-like family ATPase